LSEISDNLRVSISLYFNISYIFISLH